jgi:serine/threonine-protein kinase
VERERPLLAHVETCPACQAILDELTAECALGSRSAAAGDSVSPPGEPSAEADTFWRGLKALFPERPTPTFSGSAGGRIGGGTSEAGAAALPERLGRYELLEEIGRGGMGAVLRGHDPSLGRDLAVKVLLPDLQHDPHVLSRFTEEAQIGGQLQHPGIVPVHDVGRLDDGRPFFAMKLVQGRTLADLFHERASPSDNLPHILGIFEAVCQTVAFAHSRRVIHRDLKPLNIMVGAFGEVQVMDWGLAKVLRAPLTPSLSQGQRSAPGDPLPSGVAAKQAEGEPSARTQPGSVLGTPAYMAPEQASGEVARLDQRCDVFGLGAILCELLTGKPPYWGNGEIEVLSRAAHADLGEAFARLDACGASPELIRLAKSSLAAHVADRPRDAGVLAAELAAYRESMEARLRQAELAQAEARARAAEERKRRRLTLGLTASVLLTLVVAGGGWLWIAHERAESERQERELHAGLTREAEVALTRASSLRSQAQAEGAPGKWAEARAQARRAQTLLERLPGQSALSERVSSLLRELDDEDADHRLLARVEEIRLLEAEMAPQDDAIGNPRTVPGYQEALAQWGMPVGTPPGEAGARIRRRPEEVRARLVATLDEWLFLLPANKGEEAKWLAAVLAKADPDPWRQQLRSARRQRERARLEQLAAAPALLSQPPQTLLMLSEGLRDCEAQLLSLDVLRRAQALYPDDFWINCKLGYQIWSQKSPADSVRFFTVCAALRPRAPLTHINLGAALVQAGDLDGGIAALRHALTLPPETMVAHANLGMALMKKGDTPGALKALRRALELRPDPNAVWDIHSEMGAARMRLGDGEGAIAAFRKAVVQQRGSARAYVNLGGALRNQGQLPEALAVYRHCWKAVDPGDADSREVAARKIRETQRLIELDGKLADFLKGAEKPASSEEQLELAELCRVKQRYADATRFYAGAFAREGLANDPTSGRRFEAARCAALAAGGVGPDAPKLEAERARLRQQALAWLEADRDAWVRRHDSGSVEKRREMADALYKWQQHRDLAGIRDKASLEKLSLAERARWQRLWADVETLTRGTLPGLLARAQVHAALREWDEAARAYRRAVEIGGTDHGHVAFEYAAVLVLVGDRPGYARHCARLVERCGKAPGLRRFLVARACTLAPDAAREAARAARLADEELQASRTAFWALTQRAALHYRAGRFAEAVPLLEQSLKANSRPGAAVLSWLWLALTYQKLGKTAEARDWLDRASRWLDQYDKGLPPRAEETLGLHLHNWLEAHVLRREAEALLRPAEKR